MRNEEKILLWIILIITGLIAVTAYPPILLIGIILYASVRIYNHYEHEK